MEAAPVKPLWLDVEVAAAVMASRSSPAKSSSSSSSSSALWTTVKLTPVVVVVAACVGLAACLCGEGGAEFRVSQVVEVHSACGEWRLCVGRNEAAGIGVS